MIKLIRNAFGDKKVIKNGKGELIKWEYVVMLYEKEQEEGLRAATKLTSRHIFFHNEIMNVRLASQLLSDSVGDALLYMQTVDAKFEGCKATAEFCKIINNAFDILNSRKLYSKKLYNSAINNDNFEKYQLFTMEFHKYINDLKFEDGTNVIDSKRKTGFKGIAMGLQSALDLFKLLISKNHMTFS